MRPRLEKERLRNHASRSDEESCEEGVDCHHDLFGVSQAQLLQRMRRRCDEKDDDIGFFHTLGVCLKHHGEDECWDEIATYGEWWIKRHCGRAIAELEVHDDVDIRFQVEAASQMQIDTFVSVDFLPLEDQVAWVAGSRLYGGSSMPRK